MIDVVPATQLGESCRRAVTGVFADGFGPDFRFFAKDRTKLTDAFEHMLDLDLFFVGLVDGEPAGIAACTDGQELCIQHDPRELRRHLGPVKGTVADRVFRREFQATMPEPLPDDWASLEFVATAERFQGQGVGAAVLTHLLNLPRYRTYLIENVADTNAAAMRLYHKLGFTEYRRKKVRHTWYTGINAYVSLRLVDSGAGEPA